MLVGQLGGDSSTWSSVQETDLDQKWFVDFFDGVGFLCQPCGQRVQSDWAALIFFDDGQQQLAIYLVEAVTIHFQHLQCGLSGWQVDLARASHLRVVANAAQQPICNSRRSARTA